MALKSIIDIDVNDAKFTRFLDLYKKYQDQLKKAPGMWSEAGEEASELSKNFMKLSSVLLAHSQLIHGITEEQETQNTQLTKGERLWVSISSATKNVASHILGATRAMLRWSTLLGVGGGLLGVGSLWGMDRMAMAVGEQRRSAMGLGMSIGQEKAFGIDFGRYVDPGSFLSGVNAAATDVSKQGPLYSLGINPNGTTSEISVALMQRLRALAIANPKDLYGRLIEQYHLGDYGVTTETLNRLRAEPLGQFNAQLAAYRRNSNYLNIDSATSLKWQNFQTTLETYGGRVFKLFVDDLKPLIPSLEKFGAALIHFLGVAMGKDGPIKKTIDAISTWLNDFSGSISKPGFLKKVDQFILDLDKLADVVHLIVHHPGKAVVKGAVGAVKGSWHFLGWANKEYSEAANAVSGAFTSWLGGKILAASQTSLLSIERKHALSAADKAYGLPVGTMEYLAKKESSYGRNTVDPAGKDKGWFQLESRWYPGVNPHDFSGSLNAAASTMQRLLKQYHGNMVEAYAAYNLGPSGLARMQARYGAAWYEHAPYWRQHFGNDKPVHVVLHTPPGGNTTASVNMMAQLGPSPTF